MKQEEHFISMEYNRYGLIRLTDEDTPELFTIRIDANENKILVGSYNSIEGDEFEEGEEPEEPIAIIKLNDLYKLFIAIATVRDDYKEEWIDNEYFPWCGTLHEWKYTVNKDESIVIESPSHLRDTYIKISNIEISIRIKDDILYEYKAIGDEIKNCLKVIFTQPSEGNGMKSMLIFP